MIPYYNKLVHKKGNKIVKEEQFFDQLWEGGERCDVGQKTWDYIRQVAVSFGDNLKNIKSEGQKSIALYKKVKKDIPTIVGYNLSGFDLHFLMQKYLQDELCQKRFKLSMIYKGSSLIFL